MAGSPVKADSAVQMHRGSAFLRLGVFLAVLDQHAHVSHEGIEVFSNTGTEADLRAELRMPAQAEALDESDSAAADAVAKPDATAEPEKLKAKDAHAKIAKATWEREEAKRQADEAKAEAARLRDELGRYKAKPADAEVAPETKADDDPEPQEDAFDSYAKYVKAQARWEARQEFKEQQAKLDAEQREQARHQSAAARHEAFAGRIAQAVAKDPALKDLLASTDVEIDAEGPMPDVITASAVGVELMRHFAEHPEDAARIRALPSKLAKFREMTKLETRLELRAEAAPTGSASPAKPATKAQPPISPVAGSHVAVKGDGPPGDDASEDEHYAYWNDPKNRAKHGLK